jgi:hypothetical protein
MKEAMHRTVAMPTLLIIDEIGYLPSVASRPACSSRWWRGATKKAR